MSHRPNLALEDVNISFFLSFFLQLRQLFISWDLSGNIMWICIMCRLNLQYQYKGNAFCINHAWCNSPTIHNHANGSDPSPIMSIAYDCTSIHENVVTLIFYSLVENNVLVQCMYQLFKFLGYKCFCLLTSMLIVYNIWNGEWNIVNKQKYSRFSNISDNTFWGD